MRESDRERSHDQVAFGALVGAGVVAVLQFLSLSQLDNCLKFALFCFATSIPVLSTYLLNLFVCTDYRKMANRWYNMVAMMFGTLSFILGFAAILWHFSRIAGLVFGALCFIGLGLVVRSPDRGIGG